MPHLIDKETGLCVVCQRQDYAAIQEGKKFGRKNYDVRQLALDVITNKDDPHYREILERHYIKQSEFGGNNETQHSHEDHPKIILSEKLPIREKIVANSNFEENEDHIHADPNFIDDLRQPSRNKWRETLRKVNLATASRVVETQGVDTDRQIASRDTTKSRSDNTENTPSKPVTSKKPTERVLKPVENRVYQQESDGESAIESIIIPAESEPVKRKIVTPAVVMAAEEPRRTIMVPVEHVDETGKPRQKIVYRTTNEPRMSMPGEQVDPNDPNSPQDFNFNFNPNKAPPGVKRKRRIIVHEYPQSPSPPPAQPQVFRKKPPTQIVIQKQPGVPPTPIKKTPTSSSMASTVLPKGRYSKNALKNIEEDTRSESSTTTGASSDIYPSHSAKITKKLLSGFHPYYDEESDTMALQCCTCCIGCWRNCSARCTGCENFISCPIYCWVGFILPLFLGLIVVIIVLGAKAGGAF